MKRSAQAAGLVLSSLLLLAVGVPLPAAEPEPIVARVDGEPIMQRELDRELAPATRLLDPQAQLPAEVRRRGLAQLIDRRLVLKYLAARQQAASQQDVDLEVERLKKRLAATEKKLAQHLQTIGMTEPELRREIRWRLSWQRYLDGRLTDENLQKYFEKHRREFDGTEIKVAHLLLKKDGDDPAAMEKLEAQALSVREQIESGKISFGDACRQHSQAPTAKERGLIGFIRRREPMPESFSAAAFALEEGQISQPVQTKFGIHLVQALEIKPGQGTWQDCRAELRSAVTQYLFAWIAEQERKRAKIELVGQ